MPFLGAVLVGDFTDGSREQLRSHGFHVAYASYEMIVQAFQTVGVDVSFDENTPTAALGRKVKSYNRLTAHSRTKLGAALRAQCAEELDPFFNALRDCLGRRITRVVVLALSGTSVKFPTVQRAIRFVEDYDESTPPSGFDHYELNVRYSNGREVQGSFPNKQDCLHYLRMLYRE